jgi:hypothetical protein
MFALAAVALGLAVRAASEVPRTLAPRTDLLATLSILVIGLVLAAAAIRTVCKRE